MEQIRRSLKQQSFLPRTYSSFLKSEHQELAKQYEISGTDIAVSDIFGGAFGACAQTRFESEDAERRESLKKDLAKTVFRKEEADVQAGR